MCFLWSVESKNSNFRWSMVWVTTKTVDGYAPRDSVANFVATRSHTNNGRRLSQLCFGESCRFLFFLLICDLIVKIVIKQDWVVTCNCWLPLKNTVYNSKTKMLQSRHCLLGWRFWSSWSQRILDLKSVPISFLQLRDRFIPKEHSKMTFFLFYQSFTVLLQTIWPASMLIVLLEFFFVVFQPPFGKTEWGSKAGKRTRFFIKVHWPKN